MKLVELLQNQKIVVQLLWGEQKIEFTSNVIDNDGTAAYITPYIHNGKELDLNVTPDKGVVCNIFTDQPVTKQRISWKGIELTTVSRDNKTIYCIKTRSYNAVASIDDRRLNERTEIDVDGRLIDEQFGEISVTVHDISDTGISVYAPVTYAPKSQQIYITFTDCVGDAFYNIKRSCSISRVSKESGHNIIGCRVLGENKDYQIYELLKRLRGKANRKADNAENNESEPAAESENKEDNE